MLPARWGLVEEESFTSARLAIEPDPRRFDEIMEAVTWLIARSADDFVACPEVKSSGIRFARARVPNTSSDVLQVWFRLNLRTHNAHLIFLSISALPGEEDDS